MVCGLIRPFGVPQRRRLRAAHCVTRRFAQEMKQRDDQHAHDRSENKSTPMHQLRMLCFQFIRLRVAGVDDGDTGIKQRLLLADGGFEQQEKIVELFGGLRGG